ncbi:MAG: isocitrate dehydrogenase (NADP(+)) [Bdellovibrionaceae bacterium]|nr:isocitrate dehydrogenase (NADP(+)) [Pseudobdellovibrionaceae bacterium]|tara:strand:+ start:2668 stop:4899 length:2232 start_codon:yes stop_codon:yes gene_type:complete
MNKKPTLIYTLTDEAPFLATQSFLPIVQAFGRHAGIEVETKDISLASRILAQFSDQLPENQKVSDALMELGELAKTPEANIIKLPNISASIPQLKAAILELQKKGYSIPNFPEEPKTSEEKEIRSRYAKVLGSAVNPVLREGNSDRRVAAPVKEYAKAHPHSMGPWSSSSLSHVAHLSEGDFYGSEKSVVISKPQSLQIILKKEDGSEEVLKESIPVVEGEVVDSCMMSRNALTSFYKKEIEDAKKQGVLFSLHLKATMMKVSDPILFGACVEVFFDSVFKKHHKTFEELGIDSRNGLGDVISKLKTAGTDLANEILEEIQGTYSERPQLAMVDSDRGITNLHVPSDVIIDASMPAAIRTSGQMWGPDGKLKDTKFVIPDRSYAGVYQSVISFCKKNGAFDPKTMGNVSNVGLMAKKAEEYGSHDKTFWIQSPGVVEVRSEDGSVLMDQKVSEGDIFRACQTKDIAIRDWVKLAVSRARATGVPAVFWLDKNRAHDSQLIAKVETYLKDHDTSGLTIKILSPVEACDFSLHRMKKGEDTISVSGNVLRDYLTDLFPILELGTSAKMLSIVPLLAGGGLYETGAGGSAPKHVQQLMEENHLRWDSLGEFLALAVSIEDFGDQFKNPKAKILAQALDEANREFLNENKSPSRKVGELDNRGSHFYLAYYWAKALSEQNEDSEMKTFFTRIFEKMRESESQIIKELTEVQGKPVELGGYYSPDQNRLTKVMRPSETWNMIVDSVLS